MFKKIMLNMLVNILDKKYEPSAGKEQTQII